MNDRENVIASRPTDATQILPIRQESSWQGAKLKNNSKQRKLMGENVITLVQKHTDVIEEMVQDTVEP